MNPYADRMARLGRTIADLNLGFILITNPKDVGYLTGFLGGDSYLLLPALGPGARRPLIISDFRYKEELEAVHDRVEVFIRTKSMIEAVGEVVGAAGGTGVDAAKVGIQAEVMTIAEKAAISHKLGKGGAKRLADTINLVPKLRIIKDDSEIALIKKAAKLQEADVSGDHPLDQGGAN